ncbi:MAG: putative cupin superfamily protein [Pseudomonadales bacterium]|jgi:uncharacterized cupin superfamily protein
MSKTVSDVVFFNDAATLVDKYYAAEEKRVEGNPEQSLWNHYSDPSDQFHSGVWQAGVGRWKVNYTEYEFCQILAGVSILHGSDGSSKKLVAGDNFIIPADFSGEWEVVEETRKIYVIFEATS